MDSPRILPYDNQTTSERSERDTLLSATVDALTVVIEGEDEPRLRQARELVLDVALAFHPNPDRRLPGQRRHDWWPFWTLPAIDATADTAAVNRLAMQQAKRRYPLSDGGVIIVRLPREESVE